MLRSLNGAVLSTSHRLPRARELGTRFLDFPHARLLYSLSASTAMTSHFIDRFARRAQDISRHQQPSPSSGAPLGPASAATSSREQVEQRELAGERDDDCAFCGIVAHEEPARKVRLARRTGCREKVRSAAGRVSC